MSLYSLIPVRRRTVLAAALAAVIATGSACGMAGFGGALQLNITDQQTRQLAVRINAATDAQVIEIGSAGDIELGAGRIEIDRYVMKRSTFGSSSSTGFFLCAKPCTDPVSNYLVAYSPEHVFVASGQLELRFRIVTADGGSEEISRTINADMLPSLWQRPSVVLGSGGN